MGEKHTIYKCGNVEDGVYRCEIRNDEGDVTDIYEGPFRWIYQISMRRSEPNTPLGIRKVRQ